MIQSSNMKQYFLFVSKLLKEYKGRYALCFILQFVSVFFTLLSTFLSKILVDCLTGDIFEIEKIGVVENTITNILGGPNHLITNYWLFAIIIFTVGLAITSTNIARTLLNANVTVGISKKMRLLLFDHVQRMPFSKVRGFKSGDLIQTCTRDEQILRRFAIQETLLITYTIFLVVLSFLLLLSINWLIAVTSIVLIPFLFIYSFFIIKIVRKRYRGTDDSEGLLTAKIEENIAAVRLVKAYNNEKYEIEDFQKYLDDYRKKFVRWRFMSSLFFSTSDIFIFGQITLTTVLSLYLTIIGTVSVGTFVISFTFVNMMIWPVRDVATTLSNMARAFVSVDRMNIVLNSESENTKIGLTPPIKGRIVFDHVYFHYVDDKEVLEDISFDIEPGETIAIMGKTGSGKSTLIELLSRLYDVSNGHIYIDNIDITNIQKEYLRHNVAIVLQEPFLFSKTIEDNLKISNENLRHDDVEIATRIANVDETISSFEEGYDTPIGEKGVTLSGGQKQRLAIARTLLMDAPILVFDDSLSALDTETDLKIRSNLKNRKKKQTTIIITHRVATAKDADRILVLNEGKIEALGKHDDLIKQNGLYKRIYEIQTRMV